MEEKSWYAVHTYSGYENKVKTNLEKRIESMNMEDYIFRIMIPTEDVEEKKNDKVKINKRKVFPGYVLVEMIMTDDSWYVVRNTTGVTGFVGTGAKPIPLHESEVKMLLRQQGMEEPRREMDYEVGDNVEILDSSFRGMVGRVSEIDAEKGKVVVMLSLFGGRETPVDLDYDQVFKV
ncbi:MAG: transcription termination/antitermination protein NusG [Peptococcaceae bacterium]|nr:transcription termination/antitermination protein NusG [Peptococcaceae bacterium]MBO5115612.1 transcription termination/antitermination protein NusG [Peptococcaceae bacterium]MBO5140798.1 transcription termination/antitermination protein NusG [Peptococcaceae bacterium]MBO5300948.1 transcription termination/antitermination protein NusG [Peptococcaceae bacterium]MBO5365996.1 transcription termination/antitermination protein NusG [Peptococcaceae bacterium]